MLFGKTQNIHFVGIGGIGMSGIAEVLLNMGYKISGSDIKGSKLTDRLSQMGATIYPPGHNARYVKECDVVVVSSAIKDNNPEVLEAIRRSTPVIPRAEMLAELMRMKYGIAVAGSHGKTTTTSIIATLLSRAGLDPTIVIGGRVNSFGTNAKLGKGNLLVAETDESDGTFLKLSPIIALVTNIDREHLNFYGEIENLKETFLEFMNNVPFYGAAVICSEDRNIQSLLPRLKRRFITYGLGSNAHFQVDNISFQGFSSTFDVIYEGKRLGRTRLKIPGIHNVLNSLASIAATMELGIDFPIICEALEEFSGVERRFQVLGRVNGITVVDDYGHHPTEIKATLEAARKGWEGRIIGVFQPHRYTRTQDLFKDFFTAFDDTDLLIMTDIYSAGEEKIEGISGEILAKGIKEDGHRNVVFLKNKEEIVDNLLRIVKPKDLVITLGAGDIWKIAEGLFRAL